MYANESAIRVKRLATIVPKVSQVDNSSNFLNNIPHRKHPGILHLKCVKLPPELVQAVSFWVAQSPIRDMKKKSESFINYLWSRKRPIELKDLQKKAQLLEQKLRKDAEVLIEQKGGSLDESDEKLKQKVLTVLRKSTYHWEELKYTDELSFLYMVSRMDANYAAVSRAFHEIQKRVPDFQPKTLLDFGSGTSAVSWAAHSIWGKSLKEYINVDCSVPMLALAEKLMQGISESKELSFPGVYFRQFPPVGPKMTFDLTVSAFSLNDLPTYAQRKATVKNLWKKTNNFLVLVENGTKEGHQMLMEARDVILKGADKVNEKAHVFAPCPHHLPCPRLLLDNPLPCNFLQQYESLPLSWNPPHKIERFSFLILARGSGESMEPWPRITQPVLCRKHHIHVHLCCTDGTLQHAVVTSKKHSRDLYRCVWNSNCGDRLPVLAADIKSVLEDNSTAEDQINDSQKVNTATCQDQN
ncbi:PREDICTED: methyltransferase-like protein 17, mitochondrial [Thamnophis sirtalis]|uniref:Methyltransferase-like protein 17, mitochondrial n=1 Tax=Thamnophis sirtalis TaxID=35019 RepID=A0A6I9Z2A3_9SAUR|nr:PREDICTED: methyltransferase-like protein 17, mitochondrial [Thamnophis sirtalis]